MALEIVGWPETFEELEAEQIELADRAPERWWPPANGYSIGAAFVCFPRGYGGSGSAGDRAWAGAAIRYPDGEIRTAFAGGVAAAPYRAGYLALREGPILQAALVGLTELPEVLMVNATGRDHPRNGGLAMHLGAVMDLPSVGVTHRPLLARGAWPELRAGANTPLLLDGRRVGSMLCTGDGRRPLAVHAGWRTTPDDAVAVVLAGSRGPRTPEPMRAARRVAREARAAGL